MQNEAFRPTQAEDAPGTLSIAKITVGTSSAQASIAAVKGTMLRIANIGTGNVWVNYSNQPGATVSDTTGFWIPAGAVEIMTRPDASQYIQTIGDAASVLNIMGGVGL